MPLSLRSILREEMNQWDNDNYFTDDELETAKNILKVNQEYQQEKTTNYVEQDVSFFWASCGYAYMEHYLDNLQKVTRADIKRYVDMYLKGKNFVPGIGMPEDAIKKYPLEGKNLLQ